MTALSTPPRTEREDVTATQPSSPGGRRSRIVVAAIVVVAAAITLTVLLLGGGDDGNEPSAALIAAIRAEPVALSETGEPGAIEADEPVLDAATLRLLLEELLGEHVLIIAGASLDAADGQDLEAALLSVDPNSDALTDAISFVYGDVGARAFGSLWNQHVAFFLDRSRATSANDRAGIAEADEHFHHYERDFGSFVQTATADELPADVVTALLQDHVADINGVVAATLADDLEAAASELVAGHAHAQDIGVGLAGAIAAQNPVAFHGDLDDLQVQTHAALGRSLTAHLAAMSFGDRAAPATTAATRSALTDALAALTSDPEATRTALDGLLDTTDPERRPAAQALASKLPTSDAAAVASAFEVYVEGLDAGLLDPRTQQAHAAAYVIVHALRAG